MNPDVITSLEQRLDAQRASALSPTFLTTLIALASSLKTLDPTRVITLTEEAIPLAQTLDDIQGEARVWAIRAYAEAQIEMDEDAHLHGQMALTKTNQDPITMGYAYLGIGQYLINQFRYDEALEVGLKGYELLERAGDSAAQANIAFVIMGSYSRLGDRQQAEAYAFRAVEQYREIHCPGGELIQLNNLAMHFLWMEEYETARRLGEEAVMILRRLVATHRPFDFAYAKGAVMHTLAEIAIAQQEWDTAQVFLQEGLTFVREYPSRISPNDETFLMLALGKLHYFCGALDEARHTLLTALWRASRFRHRVLMAEITQELMKLYKRVGNYRRALWYSTYYHNIDKSRYHDQLVSKMRRMEVEYEVKIARREMEALAEKNQLLEQAYRDLQMANGRIRELSIRDGLTHLFNRQYFEEWASTAFNQCKRVGTSFGVMVCDIDNFKRINDTWLHHIGDRVLQIVAEELQAICPYPGKAARYGGEEFVLAVPTYSLAQMSVLAEEFRYRIEQYPWHTIHPDMRVTVSSGIAENTSTESLTKQLIQADLHLYLAKRQGKNRVEGGEFIPTSIDRRR